MVILIGKQNIYKYMPKLLDIETMFQLFLWQKHQYFLNKPKVIPCYLCTIEKEILNGNSLIFFPQNSDKAFIFGPFLVEFNFAEVPSSLKPKDGMLSVHSTNSAVSDLGLRE